MFKLIFDLDGTLWETGESYVYSYRKTCRQLNIPEEKIQDDSFVLKYLGMKLEELVLTIIPEAEDKMLLGKLLLSNVIEYLVSHPQTYSKNIYNLFKNLSENFELYIVSNCPRPFLEAFYTVSGIKQFIKQDHTIEQSNKREAIKLFTDNYKENAFFIGDAPSDYEEIENHNKVKFIHAAYGYKQCSAYDFVLTELDLITDLLSSFLPAVKILENCDYELVCNKGSFLTLIRKQNCCYFGFINLKSYDDFDLLIEKAVSLSSDLPLYGPINRNSWFNYRIALNDFNFKLYPDALNDEVILNKLLSHNFSVCEKYTSTVSKVNMKFWKKNEIKLGCDYECKVIKGSECNNYLEQLYEVACSCFEDHEFYEQISKEDFVNLYTENLKYCSAILILILYKGQIAAFNFCYPDQENRFFVDKTIAIAKDHRNPRVLSRLIQLTNEQIAELGFSEILLHFQNVNLKTMQSYSKGLVVRQKEYGVLKYEHN